jgi:hypothetical protein
MFVGTKSARVKSEKRGKDFQPLDDKNIITDEHSW